MHILEQERTKRNMTIAEFCEWLDMSVNTYKKILDGYTIALNKKQINYLNVNIFINIHQKLGLDLCQVIPNHPLCQMVKK